jgi:bifunctional DNA-binding transcriptional regulator/antitoxin component of YhaV-PrlF toxin-antitoxin module
MRSRTVINPKKQIVSPLKLRKRCGPKEGAAVVFREERGRLVGEPNSYDEIYALHGSLRGVPIETSLEEERRAEESERSKTAFSNTLVSADPSLERSGISRTDEATRA